MTNSRAALSTAHHALAPVSAPSPAFSPARERGRSAVLLVATVAGVIWLGSMIYTIADWATGL
ncbi:morphogenic membrane protein MmpA [Streptomyces sp. NPDC059096]|uniref:morphogenic membrane protein MmpA n=1 Tax=Streptomyces sp. NPDC059096 TaxID=3346727 RepID=UPI00369597C9